MDRMALRAAASLSVLAALGIAGCATGSSGTPPTKQTSSRTIDHATAASCAGLTAPQQFAAAKLVFDGEMLAGAVAPTSSGILASPARVRVTRYLKGNGPAVVAVQTAIKTLDAGASLVTEDGIRPRAGERWRIYTSSASRPYATSICLGSRRLPDLPLR